jgi:glyoxylate/hydroxypyruvate reductase A
MTILLACRFDAQEWADWLPALDAALPGETWRRADDAAAASPGERAAVDVAIVANPQPGQLVGYPNLGFVQSLWAGVDRLLDDPSLPAHLPLARMVDPAMTAAMAQTAAWAVLSLHRGFHHYARQQAEGRWSPLPQRRADECRVLVAGAGELGLAVARQLLTLGYPVDSWGRSARCRVDLNAELLTPATAPVATPELPPPRWRYGSGEADWQRFAAEAEVVINLLPLTPQTRGFFDAARLAGLRRGAGLVNLARGAAVVDADLLAALASGQIGHAVLDVFTQEPLAPDHPYWRHPQVTVLPHVAALTDPRSAAVVAAHNIRRVRAALGRGAPLPDDLSGRVERARGY